MQDPILSFWLVLAGAMASLPIFFLEKIYNYQMQKRKEQREDIQRLRKRVEESVILIIATYRNYFTTYQAIFKVSNTYERFHKAFEDLIPTRDVLPFGDKELVIQLEYTHYFSPTSLQDLMRQLHDKGEESISVIRYIHRLYQDKSEWVHWEKQKTLFETKMKEADKLYIKIRNFLRFLMGTEPYPIKLLSESPKQMEN